MKALLALVPVTFFALASCGSDGTGTSPPAGDGSDIPAAGVGPSRTCRPTCTQASDCATPGQPLQDAAHFACNAGRCEWKGCQSDNECTSALRTNNAACVAQPGAPAKTCVPTCQKAADCAIPGNPLSDANHMACNAGKCEWQGCKSTNDCTTSLHSSRFTCDKPAGATIPVCLPTCTKAADCTIPGSKLNDASHYACNAGKCEWLGCKSTTECATDLHTAKVVCE